MGNIVSILKKHEPNKAELVPEIIRCAQELVTAQMLCEQAREQMLDLLERYTGDHWINWKL